jgi:hypothetical protein
MIYGEYSSGRTLIVLVALTSVIISTAFSWADKGGKVFNNFGVRTCMGWMRTMHLPPGKVRAAVYLKCIDDPGAFRPSGSLQAALGNAREACIVDAKKLCLSVIMDPRARAECMHAHEEELSKACLAARAAVLSTAGVK